MASYSLKTPPQLNAGSTVGANFYIRSTKNDGSRSVSNLKGKYKIGMITPSNSNPLLRPTKPAPEIDIGPSLSLDDPNNHQIMRLTQYNFSSPKLAPLQFSRNRNTQSVDFTKGISNIARQDSRDDSAEYLSKIKEDNIKEEVDWLDEKPAKIVGTEAVEKFYDHYKKLDKIIDQNKFKDIKDSLYTSFLRRSEDLHLFPSKIGLVKKSGERAQILIKYN